MGLYTTLEIPKTASPADIKRAFRRLSLRFHPDKNPGHEDEFRNVAHAYEVLSDPKKRAVYDRYGEFGLSMLGTPAAALVDPQLGSRLQRYCLYASMAIILLLLFSIFLAARVDHDISWKWSVVFIPLWILDAWFLLTLIPMSFTPSPLTPEEEEEAQQEERIEGLSSSSGGLRHQRKREALTRGTFLTLYLALFIIFQILVVLREDRISLLSSAVIFIPYFIMEALNAVKCLLNSILTLSLLEKTKAQAEDHDPSSPPSHTSLPFSLKCLVIAEAWWWWVIRIVFVILLVLRIDQVITCHWAIIFIPLYLPGIKYLLEILWLRYKIRSLPNDPEARARASGMVIFMSVPFLLGGTLAYALIGLIIRKLQDANIPLMVVFTPAFITLATILCCTCCCLPCLLCLQSLGPPNPSEDLEGQTGSISSAQQRLIRFERGLYVVAPPSKRIKAANAT